MSYAKTILSPRDFALNHRLTSHLILTTLNSWLGKKTRSNTPSEQIGSCQVDSDLSTPMSQVFLCAPNHLTDSHPFCSIKHHSGLLLTSSQDGTWMTWTRLE